MIEQLVQAVLEEAALLGLSWTERIGVILALALLVVIVRAGLHALPPTPPAPVVPPGGIIGDPAPPSGEQEIVHRDPPDFYH